MTFFLKRLRNFYIGAGFSSCLLNVFLLFSYHKEHQLHLQSRFLWNPEESLCTLKQKPRVVNLELSPEECLGILQKKRSSTILLEITVKQTISHGGMPETLCKTDYTDCMVPGTWQETNNRNCNNLHEINLNNFLGNVMDGPKNEQLRIVAKGGKRLVWKYKEFDGTTRALKMFLYRPDRDDDFGPMTIELQRRDAIIHEVTSSSPHIVDMYGYCAASAIYEFGNGGQLEENILRDGPIPREDLLRIAHDIASSVADVHHVDATNRPTIAHSDIHGQQWIMVNGEYKLTDFNLAKLLRRSVSTNSTIPIRRAVVDNWFSPEVHRQVETKEDIGSEKMDIWNMGNVLYMILTGRAPFDGRSRSLVSTLILKGALPDIPETFRKSHESVYQTMIRAIKMCLKQVPEERPSAQYVARFLKNSVTYSSLQERDLRSTRFPSVEARVKLYMSHWYVPPCDGDSNAILSYQMISQQGQHHHPDKKVLVWEESGSVRTNDATEIRSDIVSDRICMIDPSKLVQSNAPILHNGYQLDVLDTIYPLMDLLKGAPLLMLWGDTTAYGLPQKASLSIPHFKKCRPVLASGALTRITAESCYGSSSPRHPLEKNQPGSIIWKLDSNRLQGLIKFVPEADKPWDEKKPKALFSGKLTGHVTINGKPISRKHWANMTNVELCHAIERCRFVLRHRNSAIIDAQLTDLMNKPLDAGFLSGMMGKKMELDEQLDYKVLIMLEGNDVSSGLQWALRSASVVMIPPPRFCSWSMEELLEPWVHYIPLDPSFNDTEEKMQWVLDHDEEARRIAHRGSLWVKDLHEHPDSEKENVHVNKLILERYQKLFVPRETTSS